MEPKAFVFDFDGTLVHSNKIKREAFYRLSEEVVRRRDVVNQVLDSIPEGSRFEIIERIYHAIGQNSGAVSTREKIKLAVEKYNREVRDEILACQELTGATELLYQLHRRGKAVYISSNTPKEFLPDLISARKWDAFLEGIFGFPEKKTESLQHILLSMQLYPSEVLVVGDGTSDENSAMETGCLFYKIRNDYSLVELGSILKIT
jgi:phosphoglycolate phosphatase-like HAD superfamily hydrolase